MQDSARRALTTLIQKHGPALGDDPRRLEGLLRDYVGQHRREISVLVSAAREGIPHELLDRQVNLPLDLRKARVAQRLEDNVAMSPDAARWAVEAWAEALGLPSAAPVPPPPATSPPPPPPRSEPIPPVGPNRGAGRPAWAVPTLITAAVVAGLALLIWVASPKPPPPVPAPTAAPALTRPAAAPASPGVGTSPAAATPVVALPVSVSPVPKPTSAPPAAAASPVAGGPKPQVKVASFNFDESEILMELYSQVLETNGYTIERHPRLGTREIIEPALESGQVDLVPEYLATVEAFLAKNLSKASSNPAATQKALQDLLTPKNITVLDFAQAIDTSGFVVTKSTAGKYKNLSKMSDLQPIARQLVLGGPPECPQRPFCLQGLMQVYNLQFKDFKALDTGGPLTVAALDSGDVDVGLLFTTDPNITLKSYTLLDDDKHLQLADNIVPVMRNDILTRGADARQLLNNVTSKLTTADLTDMNKQVGIDHKDAKDVAKSYLRVEGLIR